MIRFVPETGSTNADLLANRAAHEGEWLVARRQSAGRQHEAAKRKRLEGKKHRGQIKSLRSGKTAFE